MFFTAGFDFGLPRLTMNNRLSRWGIGPQIAIGTLAYAAVAGVATYHWPMFCRMHRVSATVSVATAIALLVVGFPMLALAARSVIRAYDHDRLATEGVLGLVRNPIYSAWIVFILPGLALLSRSWPMLLMPLVAYAVFKTRIHQEDEYLRQRFGQAYLEYRGRVNELIPIPRRLRS
jgi:protein-S-isoprenylcysteine O-methyltransferase Ste14